MLMKDVITGTLQFILKVLTVTATIVGAIAAIMTAIGSFAGEPDIVVTIVSQSDDVIAKLIELMDRCLEQCFN